MLLAKLFRDRAAKPTVSGKPSQMKNRKRLGLESLESREMPATCSFSGSTGLWDTTPSNGDAIVFTAGASNCSLPGGLTSVASITVVNTYTGSIQTAGALEVTGGGTIYGGTIQLAGSLTLSGGTLAVRDTNLTYVTSMRTIDVEEGATLDFNSGTTALRNNISNSGTMIWQNTVTLAEDLTVENWDTSTLTIKSGSFNNQTTGRTAPITSTGFVEKLTTSTFTTKSSLSITDYAFFNFRAGKLELMATGTNSLHVNTAIMHQYGGTDLTIASSSYFVNSFYYTKEGTSGQDTIDIHCPNLYQTLYFTDSNINVTGGNTKGEICLNIYLAMQIAGTTSIYQSVNYTNGRADLISAGPLTIVATNNMTFLGVTCYGTPVNATYDLQLFDAGDVTGSYHLVGGTGAGNTIYWQTERWLRFEHTNNGGGGDD